MRHEDPQGFEYRPIDPTLPAFIEAALAACAGMAVVALVCAIYLFVNG